MSNAVHRVYWTFDDMPQYKDFGAGELDQCLNHCEMLRTRRKEGANFNFITIASEIPECTSLSGVDVVGVGYDWKKRRR